MKKKHGERIFNRVQLKITVTSLTILLIIFSTILGLINLITRTTIANQSQDVLNQIATSIKYDEKTDTFFFTPPKGFFNEPNSSQTKPTEKTTTTTTKNTTNATTTTQTTTTTKTQDIPVNIIEDSSLPHDSTAPTNEPHKPEPTTKESNPHTENITTTTTIQNSTNPNDIITALEPVPSEPINTEPDTFPPHKPKPEPPYDDLDDDLDDEPPYDYPKKPNKDDWYWGYDKNYNATEYYNFNTIPTKSTALTSKTNYIISLSNTLYFNSSTALQNNHPPDEKKHGDPNEPIPLNAIDAFDYFVLMSDPNGNYISSWNYDENDSELAQRYINSINQDGANTGIIDNLQFYKSDKDNGVAIVFTDKTVQMNFLNQLMKTTLLIGSISFILLSILVVFLSKKSIAPVKKAFEKQKRFISDASHELKTPLTIISANADVLADEIGENKWLTYIKSQTERMSLLVNDLLNLTRIENSSDDIIYSDFNLSQAVLNTSLPFECQAFELSKKFIIEVQEGVFINGSERHIKQLIAIFIDNAIKYSDDKGTIKINLSKTGDKTYFSVYNTGPAIKEEEKYKIFERFYRSDFSRARNSAGGYGLGLAIAKSIIDTHRFKLNVDTVENKYIKFTVTI